jgi:hypothetical protein
MPSVRRLPGRRRGAEPTTDGGGGPAGESLQNVLEQLPGVDRAFVHADHELTHRARNEHKLVVAPA